MITILDIAKEDGAKMAAKSVAVRFKIAEAGKVTDHFTRKRFHELYRDFILHSSGRNPSARECDIALSEANEDDNGNHPG